MHIEQQLTYANQHVSEMVSGTLELPVKGNKKKLIIQ